MLLNFVVWLCFSFILLISFSSLKTNIKTVVLYRWLFAFIALPTTMLSLAMLKTCFFDHAIFLGTLDLPLINISSKIYIDSFRAMVIFSSLLSLNLIFFITNHLYLSTATSLFFSAIFFIILSQIFADLFFTFFCLEIGIIFLIFMGVIINFRNLVYILANNFLWLLLANFVIMIGLLLIRIDFGHTTIFLDFNNTLFISFDPYPILYFSCFTQLFILHFLKKSSFRNTLSVSLMQLHLVLFGSLSALFMIIGTKEIILAHDRIIFIASSGLLLGVSIFKTIKSKEYKQEYIYTLLLASVALTLFSNGYQQLCELMMATMLLVFPFQIEKTAKRMALLKSSVAEIPAEQSDLIESFNAFMARISRALSNLSATIIGPLYGNFFLLRLPQLLISLIQLPLRFFHNGSIQRSIIFIIIMVLSYYYMWELQ